LVLENMAATLAKEITELVQILPSALGQDLNVTSGTGAPRLHGADQGQATFCQGLL